MSRKKFLNEVASATEANDPTEEELSKLLENNIKEYGISVIEDRMVPSIRDGLKPSQRRLLKAMYDMKAWNSSPTVKSARVLGDCMGKYHPHSEAYGALQTLVNQTYSLVHGQGNWGNLDDDAAAPRYTECKFSKLGMRCFENYGVADEVPNFSGEYMEPIDIPMDFPAFFVNGGEGIGVAIRIKTPSHNLEEIVNALKIVLKKGDKAKLDDILEVFHGPDYPLGGKILSSKEEIKELYSTGSGKITYECDYTITPQRGNNFLLNITGYCPGFKPSTFQNSMIKLIDKKLVQYANDASTKENPCNFEVLFSGKDTFEEEIHKKLMVTESYRYYALDRRKSSNPELKDIDTIVLRKSLNEYMKIWLDWRREEEQKILSMRKKEILDKAFRSRCRLSAAENLAIVKKSLESDDTIKELMSLPYLENNERSREGAEYIADLKISSLRKVDVAKVKKEIEEYTRELKSIQDDQQHIDRVVSKKLDGLKEYFKPRTLKY